jgi:hypothetical protein
MKQTIIDLLKTKFEGVDESILSRIAETKAAKAVKTEEEANTYVEGITLSHLLNSYGDIRSTEAQRTAVANYEKKYGIKDGKKVSTEDDPKELGTGDDDDDTPAWAKKLMEDNAALRKRLDTYDSEKRTSSRREKLNAIIGRLPASQRKGYERTAIDTLTDEEFTSTMEAITTEVDDILKETNTAGLTFGAPRTKSQDTSKEASKAEVDAVMSHL